MNLGFMFIRRAELALSLKSYIYNSINFVKYARNLKLIQAEVTHFIRFLVLMG
jgi:hypothetical protein